MNRVDRENPTSRENPVPNSINGESPAYHPAGDEPVYEEYCTDRHVNRGKKDSRKSKTATVAATTVIALVMVAAVLPGVLAPLGAVMEPILGPGWAGEEDGFHAEFTWADASGTEAWYSATVTGASSDDVLSIRFHNDFTDRRETVTGESIHGSQADLKPGMTYTITLLRNGVGVAETSVTTDRDEDSTFFHLSYAECTCYDDGMFHLVVELDDGNGTWTDIRATLTDRYGAVSSTPIVDPGVEQIIQVDGVLTADSGVLRITCMEDGVERLLYSGTYEI